MEKMNINCFQSAVNNSVVKYRALFNEVIDIFKRYQDTFNNCGIILTIYDDYGNKHFIEKWEVEDNNLVLYTENGTPLYTYEVPFVQLINLLDELNSILNSAEVSEDGKIVFFSLCADVGENIGGYYVQVYKDYNQEKEIDNFVIHAEDINGRNEYEIAKEYIRNTSYNLDNTK